MWMKKLANISSNTAAAENIMLRWVKGWEKRVLNWFMHDDATKTNFEFNSESLRQFIYGRWQWEVIHISGERFQFPILTFEKNFSAADLPFYSISRNPNKLLFISSAIHMTQGKRATKLSFSEWENLFIWNCFQSFFCKSHFCIINNRLRFQWETQRISISFQTFNCLSHVEMFAIFY